MYYRSTRVEISLDALCHNVSQFRQALPNDIHLMAVVKGNAYGHGSIQIAKEALTSGVSYLAVAFLDEALELRAAGIIAPILVLGYTGPEGLALAAEHKVTLNVYSMTVLEAIAELATRGELANPIKIHIKLDTGMGRLGLPADQGAAQFVIQAMTTPGVEVEGLFTHYAHADEQDKRPTLEQFRLFSQVVRTLEERGVNLLYTHAGNSAAAIDSPTMVGNMVRLGISMYGFYPSEEVNHQQIQLRPVLALKTEVVMCKNLAPDAGISYGAVYRTRGQERIATLPIGYADGYSRMLTGKAQAIVRGIKSPIVGRICMDQCMLNGTTVPAIDVGDEVVLIGEQGGERISADDLARALGTIHYEITCMISRRVPRVYRKGGKIVEVVNYLKV